MNDLKEGGILISKVHHLSGRIFANILKKQGIQEINPAQGRILFSLWKKDEIPISELSEATQLEKSTLTSMLDRLEQNGYICRVPSKEDRRKILIKRTDQDRSLQEAYLQVSNEMTELFYKGLSDDDIEQFEQYLRKILDNLMGFGKNQI